MSGEFEIHRTPSDYCQIVYVLCVPNEAEFDEEYVWVDSTETHDASESRLWISERVLLAFMDRKLHGVPTAIYFYLGYLMTRDETFALSHNIPFEKILESCDVFPKSFRVKHRTTLLRALADLQDAGLIRWNAKAGTFEILYITPYDPNQKV